MAKQQACKTVVRGADGALYILSKTTPPVKMTNEEAQKLTEILENAKPKLEAILNEEIAANCDKGCGRTLDLTIPDVFME
jgi:hypothetical protein